MFKNMKIWKRFILSFSSVLIFMAAIVMVSLYQMNVSRDNLKGIIERNNLRIQTANNMTDIARDNAITVRDILLLNGNSGEIERLKEKTEVQRKSYEEAKIKLAALTPKEDTLGIRLLAASEKAKDSTLKLSDKEIELEEAGNHKEAINIKNAQGDYSRTLWINNLDNLVHHDEDYNFLRYQQATEAQSGAVKLMTILGLAAIILSAIIAFILTLSITKPLKIASNLVLSRDLNVDLSHYKSGGGELGFMIQSFSKDIAERISLENELNAYKDQLEDKVKQRTAELSNVLSEVKETVNVLASSSSQILTATTQVASGTAETASAISETTTTVEEVQQAAQLSAQKAKNVADNAQRMVKVSNDGQKAVDETKSGMGRIREQMDLIAQTIVRLSEQSQQIGGIIAAVTDIADQSNLLAVNAAIEAAKAGEHGRGFAVVAQEIKSLSGQSKQSTQEIRNILNDIQKATSAAVMATEQGSKAVEAGVKQSEQTGGAIRILSESINEAVQAASQILASSQQQVVGMNQITIAMQNINQAGTETAVSMVQSEKSAKSLHELGQKLKDLVEKFKD